MGRKKPIETPEVVEVVEPRYVLGIDPGKTGGLCLLHENYEDIAVHTCPKTPREMDLLITKVHAHYNVAFVVLEMVGAMPRMAVNSIWSFAEHTGIWIGILTANEITIHRVRPQKWQIKLIGLRKHENIGRDSKELSHATAEMLFPQLAHQLRGPQGGIRDGVCDAIHLARWGVMMLKGEVV